MPEDTIAAFVDHGKVEANLEEAQQVMEELATVGINFDCGTWQLENEGMQKFIDPFDALIQTLNEKVAPHSPVVRIDN